MFGRFILFGLSIIISISILTCESVNSAREAFNPPHPRIIGAQAESGTSGFDYQVNVFCTILNEGGAGNSTVTATLNKGGYWEKRSVEYFPENRSGKLTFNFKEPSVMSGGLNEGDYSCLAEAGG